MKVLLVIRLYRCLPVWVVVNFKLLVNCISLILDRNWHYGWPINEMCVKLGCFCMPRTLDLHQLPSLFVSAGLIWTEWPFVCLTFITHFFLRMAEALRFRGPAPPSSVMRGPPPLMRPPPPPFAMMRGPPPPPRPPFGRPPFDPSMPPIPPPGGMPPPVGPPHLQVWEVRAPYQAEVVSHKQLWCPVPSSLMASVCAHCALCSGPSPSGQHGCVGFSSVST